MYLTDDTQVIHWIKYDNLHKTQALENEFIKLKLSVFSNTCQKQNSGAFGELLFYHYCLQNSIQVWKCPMKNDFKPDFETKDAIYEIKTGTYKTSGTAHEKILGVAFKYCEIPKLYGKPLYIVCIGRAEKFMRNFLAKESIQKTKFIEFINSNKIHFQYFSDYF
jgi:hypothetical protein